MKKINLVAFALTLTLSACGQPESGPSQETSSAVAPAATASANAAPASWNQCAICHKAEAGAANGLGPNLHGILGRKAGTVAGFTYSPAMKDSGIIWDEATLDAYIEKPQGKVPGTRMSFAGQADKAKRDEIIAWLKTKS
jgi:cytochrome c